MIALVPRQGDSSLIAMAPTAPHVCEYPQCPGDINRRKLELFDDLLAFAKRFEDRDDLKPSQTLAKALIARANGLRQPTRNVQ